MTQWEQTLERLSNACSGFAEGARGVKDALDGKEPKYHTAKPQTDECPECGFPITVPSSLATRCAAHDKASEPQETVSERRERAEFDRGFNEGHAGSEER